MEQNFNPEIDQEFVAARRILDERFGKKSGRETVSKPASAGYKTAPELSGNRPTDKQLGREFSYLFYYIVRAYGVKHQLARFLFALYSIGPDGAEFEINDYLLAEHLGGTSRNYVSNMRKQLGAWINAEYDDGSRHFAFVTYKDNVFDRKAKTYVPTKYQVSPEFIEFFDRVWRKMHELPQYQYDWYKAAELAFKSFSKAELTTFGQVWQRPPRTVRTPEKVCGTLFLHFKRIISKTFEVNRQFGFDVEKTKSVLTQLLPQFIEQAYSEAILKQSTQTVKPSNRDVLQFFNQVIDYVNLRESEKDDKKTVFLTPYLSRLGDNNNYVRSSTQQFTTFENGRGEPGDNVKPASLGRLLESGAALGALPQTQSKTALDNERERFLRGRKE